MSQAANCQRMDKHSNYSHSHFLLTTFPEHGLYMVNRRKCSFFGPKIRILAQMNCLVFQIKEKKVLKSLLNKKLIVKKMEKKLNKKVEQK